MIGAFWNIRGLNKSGRINCLTDFIKTHKLDFVGLQETKKETFTDGFLNTVCKGMSWNYKPAKGTSGGILVGLRTSCFTIQSWQEFQFCAVTMVRNVRDNFVWRLIVVYGTPYEDAKVEFINELHEVMTKWQGPTVLGGILIWSEARKKKVMG
jgi:exonuclease III